MGKTIKNFMLHSKLFLVYNGTKNKLYYIQKTSQNYIYIYSLHSMDKTLNMLSLDQDGDGQN
jgi:hypothetical protein